MLLCMSLIMAVPMKSEKITECIGTPFTAGRDVIDLYQIALGKVQFTPTTFPLLLVQQGSQFALGERVRLLQSLGPIEQISIIGAGCSPHFDMSLDVCLWVFPQGDAFLVCEQPALTVIHVPVFVRYPGSAFVWVSEVCP